jgi:hypothetical protein
MHTVAQEKVHALFRCLLVLGLILANPLAWAQPAPDEASDLPVPARLSVVEGSVSFWRPGDQEWSPAPVNMALAAGDAIYAGEGATVEIQVGPRAFARLMANTELTIVRQDSGLLQLRLASGDVSLDLRSAALDQLVQIDTPNAAFAVDGNGYYRVDFRDGVSRFVVRRNGRATLRLRDGYTRAIVSGEQFIVRGVSEMTAEIAAAPAPDSWDRWNDARTDYYDRAASNRYLPQEVYGAADLDQYGTWREVPDYGPVWMPTVAPGWAPYSVGVWRWDPIYEWTWVDQAPWGWAPSHYGRWVSVSGRWAWVPGPRVARPVYMPAVVGFLGFGGGPQVGWVALSWGEPITPWWGRQSIRGRPSWGGWGGPRIVNNTVVQNNTAVNVNVINYRNSQVSHAVVAARQEDFGRHHERRDQDRHFRFATPEDGRPTPIQGVLPIRRERPAVTVAPPVAPARMPQTAPQTVINNAPSSQAPSRLVEQRRDGEHHENRPMRESPRMDASPMPQRPEQAPPQQHAVTIQQAPAPAAMPPAPAVSRPVIPQVAPPARETRTPEPQPRVVEHRREGEQHEGRFMRNATRVEPSPMPQRQEHAPPPQRPVTVQPAPAPVVMPSPPPVSRPAIQQVAPPAREAHAAEPPRRAESPESRQGPHRRRPDDQPEGQHSNSR